MKKYAWFFSLLVMLACDTRETKVQRFLLQGNEKVQTRSYQEAKHYFGEALKLDSCFSDAWNNLGTLYFKEGNYGQALSHYDRALECNPNFFQVYLNRANTFYELNQPAASLRDLETYLQNKPDTSVVFFSKGLDFTKLRKYDEAINAFRNAYKTDSTNVELLINMATVYYYKKQYDTAKQVLRKVIALKEDEPNAYNLLSLLALENGDIEDSFMSIDRALSLQPTNAFFLNNRGYLYLLSDSVDKGLNDIDQSISEDPYNAWAYRNKGFYYLKVKNGANALRLLTKANDMDSTVALLNKFIGEANLLQGKKREACDAFAKALTKDEISPVFFQRTCK
jgi:tetratricopeptide (TPR) repeat protein